MAEDDSSATGPAAPPGPREVVREKGVRGGTPGAQSERIIASLFQGDKALEGGTALKRLTLK